MERMQSIKTKQILLGAASILGMLAILGASFMVHNATIRAASGGPNVVNAGALQNVNLQYTSMGPKVKAGTRLPTGTCVAGLDSVPNFCGSFKVAGLDPSGNPQNTWQWQMLGAAPSQTGSGTTTFRAPVVPVAVQLLNPDGSVFTTLDPTRFVQPTLKSPVFSNHKYTSGPKPTQFADAVQRAEFFNQAKPTWHTLLDPQLMPELTMKIPAQFYTAVLNKDGTCCLAALVDVNEFTNLLFPPTFPVDNSTIIGAAELAGFMTTKDITTFLFPVTYLFVGNIKNCCIVGFHSFDFEPGIPSNGNQPRAFVFNYSSYILPGFFRNPQALDITALSHEMSETFNDPLVTAFNGLDITPWWFSGGNCQDDLEVGDVVEALPNSIFPITMNGMTYHPQNEALLQWFESNGMSNALDGAFSYPNESVLPTSNVSQKVTFDANGIPTCVGPLT